jgi:hypothetical protein
VYDKVYWDGKIGITQNLSFSPLLWAMALVGKNTAIQIHGLTYVRYIDDLLLLMPTKAKTY